MATNVSQDGTVGKALAVLDLVSGFGRPVRFSEILDQSNYPKATLYRLIQTLTSQGMLSFDPDRQTYSLGIRLVRLAHNAWQQSSLAPLARPVLDALAAELGETVHLAQIDSGQVLYVDKRNARDPVEMFSQAGKVGPVYCTGVGKAMLAFMPLQEQEKVIDQQSFHRFTDKTICSKDALRKELAAIERNGYSFDNEEHEDNIICVATPILSPRGRVLGGLSVTSTTSRHNLASLERLVPRIKNAAEQIGSAVNSWRFPDSEHSQATGT